MMWRCLFALLWAAPIFAQKGLEDHENRLGLQRLELLPQVKEALFSKAKTLPIANAANLCKQCVLIYDAYNKGLRYAVDEWHKECARHSYVGSLEESVSTFSDVVSSEEAAKRPELTIWDVYAHSEPLSLYTMLTSITEKMGRSQLDRFAAEADRAQSAVALVDLIGKVYGLCVENQEVLCVVSADDERLNASFWDPLVALPFMPAICPAVLNAASPPQVESSGEGSNKLPSCPSARWLLGIPGACPDCAGQIPADLSWLSTTLSSRLPGASSLMQMETAAFFPKDHIGSFSGSV